MVFDFGIRYEDLTLRVDDAVATDRCVGTTVDYSKRTPDEFQSESAVKFSPRAVTHLNVLPANPEYDGPYIDKELLRSVYLERTCQFTRQHCWPAIVLDLSVKQASLEPWLGRAASATALLPGGWDANGPSNTAPVSAN